MTLADAIAQQSAFNAAALSRSTAIPAFSAAGMPAWQGVPVEVHRIPHTLLPTSNGGQADATVIRDDGRYVILISDAPSPPPITLGDEEHLRFLAWHEYEHITRGHVFFDHPQAVYDGMRRGQIQAEERDVIVAGAQQYADDARARGLENEWITVRHHFGVQ